MGYVEPSSTFGSVFGVGENGDAAGAGAGGEVIRVAVENVEEWDYGCVYRAFR